MMKIDPTASVSAIKASALFEQTVSCRYFQPIACKRISSVTLSVASGRAIKEPPINNFSHVRCYEGLRNISTLDTRRPVSFSDGFEKAVSFGLRSEGGNGTEILQNYGFSKSCGCPRPVVTAIFDRFSERGIKSVLLAREETKALGRREVGPDELLLGLMAEGNHVDGFLSSGVTIEKAREAMKELSDGIPAGLTDHKSELTFSQSTMRVFDAALEHVEKMGYRSITPEHIVIALVDEDDREASELLNRLGLKGDKLHAEAVKRLQRDLWKYGKGSNFCIDLTSVAAEAKIDPVIGREEEIQRVVQILGRRTKNSPILLGEPGVGKTAIAEGLAIRIANGAVPDFLVGKKVASLDMGLLLSGTKMHGELEKRLTSLIDEAGRAGNVILVIDEIHTLIGAGAVRRGDSGSSLDVANILKPALAKGKFQCIGATTLDKYRTHIEKDKAFARRFQPVFVKEPSQEDAVKILLGLRGKYEEHHKCKFTDDAIKSAVYLSARYITDRYLPDKAIDLLDEAGSRAHIDAFKRRKQGQVSILSEPPSAYWQQIRAVHSKHLKKL